MSISRVVIKRMAALIVLLLCVAVSEGCRQKKGSVDPWQHLEHFWEECDPTAMDADSLEQRLVDYVYVTINVSSPEIRRKCWQTIAREIPGGQPNRTVADYLGDSESPLYAPEMLEEYLMTISGMFAPESAERVRVDYLLEEIRKNKPGARIADLRLKLEEGGESSLHKLIGEGDDGCLLLFYDPDCEECAALIARLSSEGVSRRVIAVSVTGEMSDLPAEWVSAGAADTEQLDANFYLPRLPQLYMVESDGTIVGM